MSLRMPGPWKHPDTGVYYLRQRVPADLRTLLSGNIVSVPVGGAEKVVNIGQFVKVSLGTKDPTDAKSRFRAVDAALQDFWSASRSGPAPLSHKQIRALAGQLYTELVDMMDAEPGEEGIWKEVLRLNEGKKSIGELDRWFGPTVDELFARKRVVTDALSRTRVVHAIFDAIQLAASATLRKAQGDYTPDDAAKRFPAWEPVAEDAAPRNPAPNDKFDLLSLLDHKFSTQSFKEKTRDDYRGCLMKFARFAGTSDARAITKDHVRNWRDGLIAEGLAGKTINDKYLAALGSMLNHAEEEFGLPGNVANGIRDQRAAPSPAGSKGYSAEQARTILSSTFNGTATALSVPHLRALFWVPWLCAYAGLRVTEATQLQGTSVRVEDGIPFLFITPDDGSTKSGKAWTVAIHPHLVELGLVEMFRAVGDGPAFYVPYPEGTNLSALKANARAKEAGNRVAEWITDELGIVAPNERPNHAWRHFFTTLSRKFALDPATRNHMMGSGPGDAREGYGDWPPVAIHREIVKLPRFDVEDTAFRPGNERVPSQEIRTSVRTSKARKAVGRRSAHLGRK